MKKLLLGMSLIALFSFFANEAQAQLNFFNNTPCPVRVMGVISTSSSPCTTGPYCTSTTITVGPFSSGTVPAPPCLSPTFPPQPTFVKVGVFTTTGLSLGVSICGSPVQNYVDCTGTPRTLQQFNGSQAAIF